MGLTDIFKKSYWINKAALQGAEALGEKSADPNLPIGVLTKGRAWLERNKAKTGLVFVGVCGWAFTQGCPDTYGIDWTAGVLTCDRIKYGLGLLGAFLMGGGYLDADALARAKQIMEGTVPDPRVTARAEVAVAQATAALDTKKDELEAAKDAPAKEIPKVP